MKEGEPKGPVQQIAHGLLGFFQLKSQGNPTVISDMLSCSLDLKDWYLKTAADVAAVQSTVSLANNSTGFFGFTTQPLVVPQNEIWYVHRYSLVAGMPLITDTIQFRPAARYTTASQDFILGGGSDIAGYAGTKGNLAACGLATEFWLNPGYTLGVFIENLTTASPTLTVAGAIEYVRMPI